jgi:hypothetical protein
MSLSAGVESLGAKALEAHPFEAISEVIHNAIRDIAPWLIGKWEETRASIYVRNILFRHFVQHDQGCNQQLQTNPVDRTSLVVSRFQRLTLA